ncbi:MAG: 30S ribosomal protein S6 [Chitinophagales bacterium]|nr:MAG: 30S ribosomal protein S6 [Chitinophagales bacterium]
MKSAQYETTLILTPEKSDSEVSKLIKGYVKFLKSHQAKIIHEESWGLRNLAYPIRKKTTGYYYIVEYVAPTELIKDLELNLKRDEAVLRFLTVKLDKYAIDYNERKRKGLIGREKIKDADAEPSEKKPVKEVQNTEE